MLADLFIECDKLQLIHQNNFHNLTSQLHSPKQQHIEKTKF